MITDNIKGVHISNISQGNMATIEANAAMFELLSSGVYSRKIQAVVREITCNSLDAHTVAGKGGTPISVHVPTRLEPWFSSQDFGIGLSEEAVMTLYLAYGKSLKTQTNELIGGKGIGSKSPLSYTSSFTVTSVFNGEKKEYTIYQDEDKFPRVTKIFEMYTEECNGLTVTVPVSVSDISAFEREVQNVFKWYTVKPTLVNSTIAICDESFTGKYKLNKEGYHHHSTKIIMGGVCYEAELSEDNLGADLSEKVQKLLRSAGSSVVFNLEIGSLLVTASRESISFNRSSKDKFKEIIEDFIGNFNNDLKHKINIFAGSSYELKKHLEGLWRYVVRNSTTFKYKNKTFEEYFIRLSSEDYSETQSLHTKRFSTQWQYSELNPFESTISVLHDDGKSKHVAFNKKKVVSSRDSHSSHIDIFTSSQKDVDDIKSACDKIGITFSVKTVAELVASGRKPIRRQSEYMSGFPITVKCGARVNSQRMSMKDLKDFTQDLVVEGKEVYVYPTPMHYSDLDYAKNKTKCIEEVIPDVCIFFVSESKGKKLLESNKQLLSISELFSDKRIERGIKLHEAANSYDNVGDYAELLQTLKESLGIVDPKVYKTIEGYLASTTITAPSRDFYIKYSSRTDPVQVSTIELKDYISVVYRKYPLLPKDVSTIKSNLEDCVIYCTSKDKQLKEVI